MLELLMPIGDRLKKLRREAGLTQMALAMKAGLNVSVVSQIEQGANTDPRLSTLKALTSGLGVSMDALTGDDPPAGDEPPAAKPTRKPKGK
jgi:transcriptional regulator with XRE-family HTH domain